MRQAWRLILVLLLICSAGSGGVMADGIEQNSANSIKIERLAILAKIWGDVKFFHPYLAYRDIDWDQALIKTIAKVNTANSDQDYADAVQQMLDVLDDPVTRVAAPTADPVVGQNGEFSYRLTDDNILIVTVSDYNRLEEYDLALEKFGEIGEELAKARAIVFDLRSSFAVQENVHGYLSALLIESHLSSMLTAVPISAPGQRARMHAGYMRQQGVTDTDYHSSFYIKDGIRFPSDKEAKSRPIVFLVNQFSEIPPLAPALQAAGKAIIVAEGNVTDSSLVKTEQIALTDQFNVHVRLSELIYQDGSGGFQVDKVVPLAKNSHDSAFDTALSWARLPKKSNLKRNKLPAVAMPFLEQSYPEIKPLPIEYRLLAVFRLWNIINYFFPYKELIGEDWQQVLKTFIARMETTNSDQDYAMTIAEMVSHIHDSHAFIPSKIVLQYFGVAFAPVFVRMIEGLPVITQFRDETAAKNAGIEIGDVIVAVDGEAVTTRIERLSRYVAASTPQAEKVRVLSRLLNGPEDSVAVITLRKADKSLKEVKLVRHSSYGSMFIERTGEIYYILPGNIGYVDLARLTLPMVDEMFAAFKDTRAIIFDMRGYPKGTAWEIAPRLTDRIDVPIAKFNYPLLMVPAGMSGEVTDRTASYSFTQLLPRTTKPRYKGITVMLIDERAISQAEHSGLMFKAANNTTFIGSNTMGADGEVTNFYLPGEILINFSGSAVTYPNGRQLQRIGLIPDIEVKPTLAGIQSGRDEVLESAIKYLQTTIDKTAKDR